MITGTIGAASFPKDDLTSQNLFNKVDKALLYRYLYAFPLHIR